MFIPTTKKALIQEIYKLTKYTYAEIEEVYKKVINKNPSRSIYYARKAGIRKLQGWLSSLRKL